MKESLQDGDIVFVLRWNYHPHLGDIVITNKNNPFQERIIKRVAAINDEKAVYLIGDNAGHSLDSRKIGYVSLSNVMGKVAFRLYPHPASFISYNGQGIVEYRNQPDVVTQRRSDRKKEYIWNLKRK